MLKLPPTWTPIGSRIVHSRRGIAAALAAVGVVAVVGCRGDDCVSSIGYTDCTNSCGSCPDGERCLEARAVCVVSPETEQCPLEPHTFCSDGALACLDGYCIAHEECRALVSDGVEAGCVYSTGDPFAMGPPAEGCPNEEGSRVQYCGANCSPCPEAGVSSAFRSDCIGQDESRGLGICTFGIREPCENSPSYWETVETWDLGGDESSDLACMTLRAADGSYDRGHLILRESCLAYLERYPDFDAQCRDRDWNFL